VRHHPRHDDALALGAHERARARHARARRASRARAPSPSPRSLDPSTTDRPPRVPSRSPTAAPARAKPVTTPSRRSGSAWAAAPADQASARRLGPKTSSAPAAASASRWCCWRPARTNEIGAAGPRRRPPRHARRDRPRSERTSPKPSRTSGLSGVPSNGGRASRGVHVGAQHDHAVTRRVGDRLCGDQKPMG